MVWGLEPSLSLILIDPVLVPTTLGEKVTLKVQPVWGSKLDGQLLF